MAVTSGHETREGFVMVIAAPVSFVPTDCGLGPTFTFIPSPGSPPPPVSWIADLCGRLLRFIGPLRLDGPQWTDCGQFATATVGDLRQAIVCGANAIGHGMKFLTSVQTPGHDSGHARGLFAGSDAVTERFTYDSGACTPTGCPAQFQIEPCTHPTVVEHEGPADFACSATSRRW